MFISEDVLMAMAGLSVALIGFSGVVSALGRRGQGQWTPVEMLQLRTLLEPGLNTLFGAFVPIVLALVISDEALLWRVANGVLLGSGLVCFSLFWLRGAATKVLPSQMFMTAIAVLIFSVQVFSVFNIFSNHALAYALGLMLGLAVSVHNFYLLLFAQHEEAVT